jgi:hypothetical protein
LIAGRLPFAFLLFRIMDSLLRVVFVRSGCALILAAIGGLAGLVAWAIETAQKDFPRSPSSIVWAAVGAAFGFILGASVGIRRLSGRSAWLISGLVAGILAGAFIGWEWAFAEYSSARLQLLRDGIPAEFIDAAQGGLSVRAWATIGLQYGICLGVLAGATGGWLWKHPPRVSTVANLFPVMTSCFIALGAITMNTGLRSLSTSEIHRRRQTWEEWQTRERKLLGRIDASASAAPLQPGCFLRDQVTTGWTCPE